MADARIEAAARRFALGEITRIERIPAGTINSNYAVQAASGRFFLRINEGKREEEVAYEAELVTHLSGRGVPTPCPVPDQEGRPFAATDVGLVTVFPWVDGDHREGAALSAHDLAEVGASLASLHLAGVGFGTRARSRYAFERIVDRYEGLAADCCDPGLVSALDDVGPEIAWLNEHVSARADLPQGVIHGDLFPDNVLYAGDRLVALLDFEQASDGAFAYDLAVCLCAWCFDDDFVAERARALVAGYEGRRRLEVEERRLLYVEARAAAMRFTVTRITDVYLDPDASPALRKAKDFRRFQARLRRLRAMGEDGFETLTR